MHSSSLHLHLHSALYRVAGCLAPNTSVTRRKLQTPNTSVSERACRQTQFMHGLMHGTLLQVLGA